MADVTDIFCEAIDSVYLEGNLNSYDMQFILSVCENDHIITILSGSKIKGLERGWFGNLNCNTKKAFDVECEEIENINPIHCIKDVVLKEIQIESEGIECPTYFTYVFLKI